MRYDKLLKLADFLEKKVHPADMLAHKRHRKKFDMNYWGAASSEDVGNSNGEVKPTPKQLQLTCTTAGCAAGWATALFKRGPRLTRRGNIVYHRRLNIEACALFWGLSLDRASEIFAPGDMGLCRLNAKQTAARIRRTIKRWQREDRELSAER